MTTRKLSSPEVRQKAQRQLEPHQKVLKEALFHQ